MYAYVSFLFVILTYGMETAFFRYSTIHPDKDRVYGTSMFAISLTSIFFVIIIILFSNTLASGIGYSDNPEYVRWFGFILAADALSSIPYAKLRFEKRALRFAIIKVSNIFVNISLNLLFLVIFPYLLAKFPDANYNEFIKVVYNPEIGVGYIFISNLVASVMTLAILSPGISITKQKFDFTLLKSMLSYAWPLLIFGLAGIINETFDRIILKHLLPPGEDAMEQLGIYGACYKISILMTLFIQTYRYAAEPFFFDHSTNKNARKTYARLMHYFIIVCLFIYLLITLNLDYVLLFIGKEYRAGAAVIPVLLWANLFLGVFYNLSVWFKLTDKTKTGAMISLTGALITLVLNFILIPVMGYMGAAWATFVCYGVMMVISWYLGQKYYPVNYNLRTSGMYSLLALCIYIISLFTDNLNSPAQITLNIMLLFLFLLIVYLKERLSPKVNTIETDS